ncbi:MAG: alpha/beta fold hydrolase [Oscillatoriaceae bacterium SKW80]|nr:alpha/beta fold hydrolase [Oscillatoriaceae bacterium SKYG93]MCX8121754.1 alpha/beta fold hydrolase [Oscillatoriaceae bacterium SKW80]MDW8453629.1 YqiA/YcfP family alpha/beta fold hydrolase [Oscillatoriaceae cyanobacterium SKYGB_i_bin93]HIK28695.1 alpha/beta fold hydrolase [Oscillatoriaceae cyanobacterium M7585_C2015_266]
MQSSDEPTYIYLHGFASSPKSAKARYLGDRFAALGLSLKIPDLNQGDFSNLTLTRQIKQVAAEFPPPPSSITLIGSSFGGLTAAWLAQMYPQVQRLILLAPAFQFLQHWLPKLGEEQLQRWQVEVYLPVYHYGEMKKMPLNYRFIEDILEYAEQQLQRAVPTLILHGVDDEVIPIQASRDFAAERPWVKLLEIDSDHALGNVQAEIWEAICQFCQLPSNPG